MDFPGGSAGKEFTRNAGDLGSILGLGRSIEEGKGYPLQYSGLENSKNCIVHGVTKSQLLVDRCKVSGFSLVQKKNSKEVRLCSNVSRQCFCHMYLLNTRSCYLLAPH